MKFLSFVIHKNDEGKRADSVCKKLLPALPFSVLMKKFRTKHIRVNSARAATSVLVREGDTSDISPFLYDKISKDATALLDSSNTQKYARGESSTKNSASRGSGVAVQAGVFPYAVLYERNGLLIIEKPAGTKLFPKTDPNTAAGALAQQYADHVSISFTPAPCHQLDTGTSGVLMTAYDAQAARTVHEMQVDNRLVKIYAALLSSELPRTVLEHALYRDRDKKITYAADISAGGRNLDISSATERISGMGDFLGNARTFCFCAGSFLHEKRLVYLHAFIITGGKTHQLRAQCRAAGAPVYGDAKYGFKRSAFARGVGGIHVRDSFFLHAAAVYSVAPQRAVLKQGNGSRETAPREKINEKHEFPSFVHSLLPRAWKEKFRSEGARECFAVWDRTVRSAGAKTGMTSAREVFEVLFRLHART